jgi:putative aldouronate transport system permease protein
MRMIKKWSGRGVMLGRDLRRNWLVYLMLLPVLAYYAIFCYAPLTGVQIAFKNFNPSGGLFGGTWVGLEHFKSFFGSYFFGRTVANTALLSLYSLLFSFPAPIVLALLINEVGNRHFILTSI